MSAVFPAPVRSYTTFSDASPLSMPPPSPSVSIPLYPYRTKHPFVPRRLEDFGDGGAYPELQMAQFPLEMGKTTRNGSFASSQNTLALQVRGNNGTVRYDAIVTQQHRDKTNVFTTFDALVEKTGHAAVVALPTKDEEIETTTRTREALQVLVQGKVTSALPTNISGRVQNVKDTAKYIRYTPNDQQQQRIIRMVDVAKDPMEPPKFQHTKAVRGPPSPPVPVLHSPPRKLTLADQQSWKIPPCISNWKNSKGFTIALDKRLAADGRGLQQVTINDNFASLSEALAIAERNAREEVNLRAQVHKKVIQKQKEQHEAALRELASKARMERAGIRACSDDDDTLHDDDDGQHERDAIRRERKKARERDLRLTKLGKQGKAIRDKTRDISEKIALGQLQATHPSDGLFDARLFNQSQGLNSGFGHEDEYTVYSKPMVDRGPASVYRPTIDTSAMDAAHDYEELKQGPTKRFQADTEFRGTVAGTRDGPVQFSKEFKRNDERQFQDKNVSVVSSTTEQKPRSRSKSNSSRSKHLRSRSHGRSMTRNAFKRSVSRSYRDRSASRRHVRSYGRERRRERRRSYSSSSSRERTRRRSYSSSSSRGRTPRRRSLSSSRSRSRSRRCRRSLSTDSDVDPFGLDQFLTDARKGVERKRRRH
ncbi:hypothetical protein CCR75_004529 [Bremia lactucae]|uniref:SKI-interacting protein SKIP SNW domain-containing protein n=1 Tax=Bremia lactucae TaxID=4779 RepID=A0A976FIY9_BRELC|nr:hypothetical protein CCR75_004529 [Bremia lactucae]